MKNKFVFIMFASIALVVSGCAGNSDAISTMQRAGFKDVSVTDSSYVGVTWHGCSDTDNAAFDIAATNPAGDRTTATVCCGTLKKCTIRY